MLGLLALTLAALTGCATDAKQPPATVTVTASPEANNAGTPTPTETDTPNPEITPAIAPAAVQEYIDMPSSDFNPLTWDEKAIYVLWNYSNEPGASGYARLTGHYRWADKSNNPLVRRATPEDQGQQIFDQVFGYQLQAAFETGSLKPIDGVLAPVLDTDQAIKMLSGVFRNTASTPEEPKLSGYFAQQRDALAGCEDPCGPSELIRVKGRKAINTSEFQEFTDINGKTYMGKEVTYYDEDGSGGKLRFALDGPVTSQDGERYSLWRIDTALPADPNDE